MIFACEKEKKLVFFDSLYGAKKLATGKGTEKAQNPWEWFRKKRKV